MLCPSCHRKHDITDTILQTLRSPRKSVNRTIPVKEIQQLTTNGEVVAIFINVKEAHQKTGINLRGIHNVISGNAQTAGGFIFKSLN